MNFVCRPRSWANIRDQALKFRRMLNLSDEPYFPVMEVMEKILDQRLGLIELQIGTAAETKGAEGLTDPAGAFLMLRDDVYRLAWAGNGRARFTASHELGHWVLHTGQPLALARQGEDVAPFRQVEPQANRFAAELLMPAKFISSCDTEEQIMDRHGVSRNAAANRLKSLIREA